MSNRLASEGSPYLQQHADNPVDWWPWCDKAFEEAKRRDVPVFLSVGYATCHWCHVMAHESFEDDEVAAAMNEAFVCVKVDREERPDVDDVYMAACQTMTGGGGWPLTVMLDHDRRPWFAGTYFPKRSMAQRIGMLDLVPAVTDAWKNKRDELTRQGKHLVEHLRKQQAGGDVPDHDAVQAARTQLMGREDKEHGGFGSAPKFPSLHQVRLLLRGGEKERAAALRQLDAMARAGIRDHVAGGFHRYSTDPAWHLPHFEKMLYDQAMALWAYAEAYHATGDERYVQVLDDTAAYLEREMRHASGAFFAAQDADSEGEEGRFATWPWGELVELVGEETARSFGARPGGNFFEEATREPVERNILFFADDRQDLRDAAIPALLERRQTRVPPLRDEKVLADWNGLAVAGLAAAARATGDGRFLRLATGAADGVWDLLFDDGMHHAHIAEKRGAQRFLEDAAAMARGLLLLYEVSGRPLDLERAVRLLDLDAFAADNGTFHRTPADAEALPARPIDLYDGATPSGNTLAAEAMVHAAQLTGGLAWEERAQGVFAAASQTIAQHPVAHTGMLVALDDMHRDWRDVVVAAGEKDAAPLLEVARRAGSQVHVLWWDGDNGLDRLVDFLPPMRDEAVAYVCRGDACESPIDSVEALRERLAGAVAKSEASRVT